MALTVGTDTYATEAEAADYATMRGWATFPTGEALERLLKAAAIDLDNTYTFKGSIVAEAQLMAWPRSGATDKEGRTIGEDIFPTAVKRAQIELAHLMETDRLGSSVAEAGIQKVKAGSVEVTYASGSLVSDAQKARPITQMLAGFIKSGPGRRRTPRNVSLLKA